MSFAKLLSKDAGIGAKDNGGSNVDESDAASKDAALHDVAKRMLEHIGAGHAPGLVEALKDFHELHGASGTDADAKPESGEPYGAEDSDE